MIIIRADSEVRICYSTHGGVPRDAALMVDGVELDIPIGQFEAMVDAAFDAGKRAGRQVAYEELEQATRSPWQWRRLLRRLKMGQSVTVRPIPDQSSLNRYAARLALDDQQLDVVLASDPDTALLQLLERLPARDCEPDVPPERLTGEGWTIVPGSGHMRPRGQVGQG